MPDVDDLIEADAIMPGPPARLSAGTWISVMCCSKGRCERLETAFKCGPSQYQTILGRTSIYYTIVTFSRADR